MTGDAKNQQCNVKLSLTIQSQITDMVANVQDNLGTSGNEYSWKQLIIKSETVKFEMCFKSS